MSKIYCLNCGNEMEADTKFCPSCGAANTQYAAAVEAVEATFNGTAESNVAPESLNQDPVSAPDPVPAPDTNSGFDQNPAGGTPYYQQPAPAPEPAPAQFQPTPVPQPQTQYQYQSQNTYSDPYSQYQQPNYNQGAPGAPGEDGSSKALAIVSLVLGIISLVCCCWSAGVVGILFSGAAVVCGIIAVAKHQAGKGMAIGGLICGGVALLLSIIMMIASLTMDKSWAEDFLEENYPDIYEQIEDSF